MRTGGNEEVQELLTSGSILQPVRWNRLTCHPLFRKGVGIVYSRNSDLKGSAALWV